MQIRPVDPRDETGGVDDPAYRVYFWDSNLTSDEYEITEADVHAVVRWADAHADDRQFSLYVRLAGAVVPDGGVMLVRLAGWDAATSDDRRPPWAVTVPEPRPS